MILITGGLGFLGCNLARLLCAAGEKVLLTSNRNTTVPPLLAPFLGASLNIAPLDMTAREEVFQAVRAHAITAIVHAAVRSEKGNTTLWQSLDVNVGGTMNVLEAAHRAAVRRVLFISSEAVYQGMAGTDALAEEERLYITSDRFVPGTKKAGEILCLMYAHQYGMEAVSVRLTRVYGPLYKGIRNIPGHMLESAARELPIELGNQDPDEAHDFIYAKDAAQALSLMLRAARLRHRIYNVGYGKLTSIGAFAGAIRAALPDLPVHVGDGPGPLASTKTPMDIDACVDISRIRDELGFSPAFDPSQAIDHYLSWAHQGRY